jgi:hypothetical protein
LVWTKGYEKYKNVERFVMGSMELGKGCGWGKEVGIRMRFG